MQIIYAPEPFGHLSGRKIFLAGSIEQGTAEDWQQVLADALADTDLILLNPRRPTWDASLPQSADHPVFREQVEWELSALEAANRVVFYFAPGTKSPVSLLELGLFARSGKAVVCCPDGFWRKGNVDIVCERYGVRQAGNLEELAAYLIRL